MTFVPETILKRDEFSETISGHLVEHPDRKVVLRKLDTLPWYTRSIAWFLARREIRGLRAVHGIEGTPELLRVDDEGLLRDWTLGTPLQLSKPDHAEWYQDAKRLLREMRRQGVTHNDVAKPQNWLMTPDGRAAVIDFQLASVHRRRGLIFRLMAREDLRHLLKQKRAYAKHLLTPSEKRMLARKSLPARLWKQTGKRLYNFITRRLFNWSDGEGTLDRVQQDGPAIRAALSSTGECVLCTYALPAKGVGIYTFVECDLPHAQLRNLVPENKSELIQPVASFPRHDNGTPREDILQLIASNRLDELETVINGAPEQQSLLKDIISRRQNLTDRVLRK